MAVKHIDEEDYNLAVSELKELLPDGAAITCVLLNTLSSSLERVYRVLTVKDGRIVDITTQVARTRSYELVRSLVRCEGIRVWGSGQSLAKHLSYLLFNSPGHIMVEHDIEV